MTTVVIISLVMAVAYIAAVIIREKSLPDSISALVNYLPQNWKWLWSAWLVIVGGMACAGLIEALPEDFKFVGFLTMACIGFTAAMPIFEKEQYKAHNIFGSSACVMSQLCVMLINPWLLMLWPIGLVTYFIITTTKWWWYIRGKEILLAEIVCGMTVYATLAI